MGGLTTPKSRLMRDVCRGLAGFCAGDGKKCHARSGDRTPCSLILFQARGPGSKYHGPCGGFRAVAQSGHEQTAAFDRPWSLEKSIALASADRKAGLVISMGLTLRLGLHRTFSLIFVFLVSSRPKITIHYPLLGKVSAATTTTTVNTRQMRKPPVSSCCHAAGPPSSAPPPRSSSPPSSSPPRIRDFAFTVETVWNHIA